MGQVPCIARWGDQHACAVPASGGAPSCSANVCIDTGANPIVEEPVVDEPGVEADGAVDADGNCLGTIEIFSGRAARCRPAGLSTTFQNCCKDKGKIVKDGMGSSDLVDRYKDRRRQGRVHRHESGLYCFPGWRFGKCRPPTRAPTRS
jgi:hypothetical protein